MKKLLLLIISLSSLIYAQIDISQFYTIQIAENELTCQQIEKFVKKYNNKTAEVYHRTMDARGNCKLELRVYKCPKIQESTYYYLIENHKLSLLYDLDLFVKNCVDTTKFTIGGKTKKETGYFNVGEMYGFVLEKIPDKKDIKWRKE